MDVKKSFLMLMNKKVKGVYSDSSQCDLHLIVTFKIFCAHYSLIEDFKNHIFTPKIKFEIWSDEAIHKGNLKNNSIYNDFCI